jgi:hypothetical protein
MLSKVEAKGRSAFRLDQRPGRDLYLELRWFLLRQDF